MMNAELKNHNGAMTLFIQGQPYPLTTYKPTELNDDKLFATTVKRSVADMAARGVHVHFVPIFFKWTGPRQYDFSPMDWRVNTVLQADPAAWIVIRVQAGSMAPAWWLDANPDGVLTFGLQPGVAVDPSPFRTHRSPSLGSDFWQEAGLPALQALAEHVRQQPYLGRIIGYLPTSYNSNEWFFRSYDELQVSDLCPAMRRRLQQWLKEGWSLVSDVPVPDRVARQYGDRGYFFQPDPRQSHAPVTAYYQLVNRLCAETIVKICQTLRAVHAPDRIIVGTFYGYAQGLANFYWLADSGHLALARLLEQNGPDFTCSPPGIFYPQPAGAAGRRILLVTGHGGGFSATGRQGVFRRGRFLSAPVHRSNRLERGRGRT